MLSKLLIVAFFISGQVIYAQSSLNRITLKIDMYAKPTVKDAGLSNSQNFWNLEYELRIQDDDFESKPLKKNVNNKLDKLIAKGKFNKNDLKSSENRSFSADFSLDDKLRKLLLLNKPYLFLLRLKSSVKTDLSKSILTSSNLFDIPFNSNGKYDLKNGIINIEVTLEKKDDGNFIYSVLRK